MTLIEHIEAIQAIIRERHDAESERIRAWMESLPVSSRVFTDEERAKHDEAMADWKAGSFHPGEQVGLILALRALRESVAPALAGNAEAAEWIASIEGHMERASEYIYERRLFVAPEPPVEHGEARTT